MEMHRTAIADWIVRASLDGADEIAVLAGVCERLNALGFSLMRASVANNQLDPTYDARGVRWLRNKGGLEEAFERTDPDTDEEWLGSPFYVLLQSGENRLRRHLDARYRRGEFSLLDGFVERGATDYVAFASRVAANVRLGEGEGIAASWLTDAPAGFTDRQLALIEGIVPALTIAFMLGTTTRTARTVITTYLGSHAAERVLAGNIVRGRATPIRAVVWFSDLTGFTRISDATDAKAVLALLNTYAEAQVEAIEALGGHVLKFIGDGILAFFPDDDPALACRHALDAAVATRDRIDALNEQRAAAGLPVTRTHVALHVGELLYGNLGSARRLDFTVLGPAVNEASRIESAVRVARPDDHRVAGVRGDGRRRRTRAAREPRPLCDEGCGPAAGAVHAGSGVPPETGVGGVTAGVGGATPGVGGATLHRRRCYSDFRYCARSVICSSDIPSERG
jgi:adenylate cyclase